MCVLWGRDMLDVIKDWLSSRRAYGILNREDVFEGEAGAFIISTGDIPRQ